MRTLLAMISQSLVVMPTKYRFYLLSNPFNMAANFDVEPSFVIDNKAFMEII